MLSTSKRLARRRPHARSSPTARTPGLGVTSSSSLNASRASGATNRAPTTTSSSGNAISARWYASAIRPRSTCSRRELRRTLISPSSTQGVPPIRSSVENVKPCSLPSIRAMVIRTQSSLAFESSPMPKAPPIDASSSRSASVSAAESFVCTWTAISPLPIDGARWWRVGCGSHSTVRADQVPKALLTEPRRRGRRRCAAHRRRGRRRRRTRPGGAPPARRARR